MKCWIVFEAPNQFRIATVQEDFAQDFVEWASVQSEYAGLEFSILPIDIPDADIARLFGAECAVAEEASNACPQCDGEKVVDLSIYDTTPVLCDHCNGTGKAGAE